MDWRERRLIESRGFISSRLLLYLMFARGVVYLGYRYVDYGKFGRILNPENIGVENG